MNKTMIGLVKNHSFQFFQIKLIFYISSISLGAFKISYVKINNINITKVDALLQDDF